MKAIVNRIAVVLIAGTLSSAIVLGKPTRKEVTFANAVTVNGTLVKKGTYDVTFDDQTNQLTIAKGKKVVAQAQARVEKVEGSKNVYVTRAESGDPASAQILVSVALKDGNQATIVAGSDDKAAMKQ